MAAAVDAGYLAQTPCRNVPLPKIEREEMRFLTPAEIVHLAEVIHPRYRALVFVGAYGGLRIGELAGLRRRSCRSDARSGHRGRDRHRGEGQAVLRAAQDASQPANGRAAALRRPPAPSASRGTGSPNSHVFTAPNGGPLRIPSFRARFWVPATKAAGLEGLRIHDLRHTAVALWIAAGATPKEVAVRAGHTSVSFTLDRYGHLYPESDTTLRDRLEALHSTVRPADGVVIQVSQ